MKKRVIILLLFLASVVLGDRIIGSLLGQAFRRISTGEAGGQINAALAQRDADVIVFGSSLAKYHVDPREFERELGWTAYNAGCNGQDIYYARMLESLLLRRGCPSRLFIYVVNWSDLYRDDLARAKMFAAFADEDPEIAEILSDGSSLERLKLDSHAYCYNTLAVSTLRHTIAPVSEGIRGFVPVDTPYCANPQDELQMATGEQDLVSWDLALMVRKLRLYADLVHAARENSTDVWFVVGPTYRAGRQVGQRERYALRQLRSVAQQAGARFLVLDESSRAEFSDQRYFGDQRHLNAEGARIFSRELVRLVQAARSDVALTQPVVD